MEAVTRPSTIPIARWIGCISITNVPKGNSVFPENNVSSTTENAPNCKPITAEIIEATKILRELSALRVINLYI